MMGFFSSNSSSAGNQSSAGRPEGLFDRYAIDRNKKYGEGGYGATFAAVDKKTGEPRATFGSFCAVHPRSSCPRSLLSAGAPNIR